MKTYQTSTTVEEAGQIRICGVPFAPGTEVEVAVSRKENMDNLQANDASERVERLYKALDKARNVEPITRLKRDELYDRNILH